jgi:hypothetical protein
MFKVLPRVKRFGTAIIGPQSEKKVSSLADPFRGLGGRCARPGQIPGGQTEEITFAGSILDSCP